MYLQTIDIIIGRWHLHQHISLMFTIRPTTRNSSLHVQLQDHSKYPQEKLL